MSTFRSNLNSINNGTLLTARHNDTHSNDAINSLFTDIYTAVPNAVIVDFGVNYRVVTSDFQAWATYYNPDAIYNPAATDKLEIISQYQPANTWAYTGEFEIYDDTQVGAPNPGTFFCLKTVDYENPAVYDVMSVTPPIAVHQLLDNVISPIAVTNALTHGTPIISLYWSDGTGNYKTTFDATIPATQIGLNLNIPGAGCTVMLFDGGTITGDALPALATTGRYAISLTEYII